MHRARYEALILLSAALFVTGCFGPEFERLSPGRGNEYGEDVRGEAPEDAWHWVRGRVHGDVDGVTDAAGDTNEEEVLLVTRQYGSRDDPGPMEAAWLVICRVHPGGDKRQVLRREPLPLGAAAAAGGEPESALHLWTPGPIEDASAHLHDLDGDGVREIFVRLHRPTPEGAAVAHAAYAVGGDGGLFRFFACRAVQTEPALAFEDIDRDGVDEIVVPAAILPPRPEAGPRARPAWPCVYTVGADGIYHQDNASYADFYAPTRLALYENMALERAAGATETLPVYALYLGLTYTYGDENEMARAFLRRAAAAPGNPGVLARRALEGLGASDADPAPRGPDMP